MFVFAVYPIDHGNESSLRERNHEYEKQKEDREKRDAFSEISAMREADNAGKEFVLQVENVNVGPGYLVKQKEEQVNGRKERRKEIEYLDLRVRTGDLPSGDYDVVFHSSLVMPNAR